MIRVATLIDKQPKRDGNRLGWLPQWKTQRNLIRVATLIPKACKVDPKTYKIDWGGDPNPKSYPDGPDRLGEQTQIAQIT